MLFLLCQLPSFFLLSNFPFSFLCTLHLLALILSNDLLYFLLPLAQVRIQPQSIFLLLNDMVTYDLPPLLLELLSELL